MQSLLKETAIYGMSSIVGRFLNYLLVPLYTAKMSVESGNYGVVTNIYAWTAVLLVILTFGFETTFFRFASKEKANVSKVFSMSMQVVGTQCGLFLLAIFCFLPSIARTLGYEMHPEFIGMMAVVVALDALQAIPFGLLRLQKRPIKFASLKLLNIFTNIALNLFVFIALPHLYAKNPDLFGSIYFPGNQAFYVFFINLACTAGITFFLIPELKMFRPTFDKELLKSMFRYSWPLLILGIAGILNLHADTALDYELIYFGKYDERLLSSAYCLKHTNHVLGLVLGSSDVVDNYHLIAGNLRGKRAEERSSLNCLIEIYAIAARLRSKRDTAVYPLRRTGGTLSCVTGTLLLPGLSSATGNLGAGEGRLSTLSLI